MRLVGGVEGRAAQLNLGREVRQAHALAVIFWVEDEDQLDRLRNLAPDLWAHRSYVVLLLEWEDHAKEPPREAAPDLAHLIAQKRGDLAGMDPDDPMRISCMCQMMRLHVYAGEATEARALLREAKNLLDRIGRSRQWDDELGAEIPRTEVSFLVHDGYTDAALALADDLLRNLRARSLRMSVSLLLSAVGEMLRIRLRLREAIDCFQEAAAEIQKDMLRSAGSLWNVSADRIDSAETFLAIGLLARADVLLEQVSRDLLADRRVDDIQYHQHEALKADVLAMHARLDWLRGEHLQVTVDTARGQARAIQLGLRGLSAAQGALGRQISVELGVPPPAGARNAAGEAFSFLDATVFEWRTWPLPWSMRQGHEFPRALVRGLRQQLRVVDRIGPPDVRIRLREVLAWVAWCQRRYDEARRHLRWLLHAAGPTWGPIRRAKIHSAMARVELSDHHPHDALAHVTDGEREHAHEPDAYRSRFVARDLAVARAEALLQLERVSEARAVLVAARAALRAEGLILPWFDVEHLLLTLPLEGDAAERRQAAEEVWAATQQSGALWFEARALVDLAWVRRQSGENVDGLLDEAAWVFERFGDDEQLARAKSLYSGPPAPARGPV